MRDGPPLGWSKSVPAQYFDASSMRPGRRVRVGPTHGPSAASPSARRLSQPIGSIFLAMPERQKSGPVATPDGPLLVPIGASAVVRYAWDTGYA